MNGNLPPKTLPNNVLPNNVRPNNVRPGHVLPNHVLPNHVLPNKVRPVRVVTLKRVPPQSRSEEPFVWRGSALGFRMMGWTNEVLLRASPPRLEVRRSPLPLFGPLFQEDRPLFGQPGVVRVDPAEKLRLPLQEILPLLERPGPPFHYFSADVLEQFPTLSDDIAELGPFVSTPEHCLVSLWIGQPGVAAQYSAPLKVEATHKAAARHFTLRHFTLRHFTLWSVNAGASLATTKALPPLQPRREPVSNRKGDLYGPACVRSDIRAPARGLSHHIQDFHHRWLG